MSTPIILEEGLLLRPGYFSREQQELLLEDVRSVVGIAPLFVPVMPKTGKSLSVRMTNCGDLGWVTDREGGYRYQDFHPVTGEPWPKIPQRLLELWRDVSEYDAPPQACLVNFYEPGAKMGLHQDRDEKNFKAPVVSVSLGDACLFRVGGLDRRDSTRSFKLESGDVLVLGGKSRLRYHGVDRIYPGTSTLLRHSGRVNLTMRRVTD
ncbi:alpha-ketoglutarate-dependent dioxygenase AlkB [Ciceribacter sp. L1K22]|uniref:alpha-ketoglutarate-dependent dioxygenase AlkB family protein n=1 Tax=Ciceribacter sp. L1K22 TaxID=2820275 RepID=UPI001ABDD0CB|nr:alpha-ketoglutarate-dependent dioxygenase AlkB [Ciceribacter sp. L1K22]MBO3758306.1 alpha-ketoglutarate-dependent dioxygenase AlkB [Ciceribacter sp. L1K22]